VTQSIPCAVCGHGVEPDTDYVKVHSETVRINDRNAESSYWLHIGCASRTISAWEEPS
jgi:hypothetical protein